MKYRLHDWPATFTAECSPKFLGWIECVLARIPKGTAHLIDQRLTRQAWASR